MKLLSVNVGRARTLDNGSGAIPSAILKTPQPGAVFAGRTGLQGDEQADRAVHGGIDKAAYAFPHEHYEFYGRLLNRSDFVFGLFGENLTIEGFKEDQVLIGDRLRIGDAIFEVSQPRIPCAKLGCHLKDARVIQIMINTLRTGFYLRVLEEGHVRGGDVIEHVRMPGPSMTVSEIAGLRLIDKKNLPGARQASRLAALPQAWKEHFLDRSSRAE